MIFVKINYQLIKRNLRTNLIKGDMNKLPTSKWFKKSCCMYKIHLDVQFLGKPKFVQLQAGGTVKTISNVNINK